ncbi:MAG: hypothetical protein NTW08_10355 [Gammaproteobacteria bacterium]|nr:hypothetical protein [Gammaproteobacteria bacterium]
MMFFKKIRIRLLTRKVMQLQQQRTTQQVADEAVKREIAIYHKLSCLYSHLEGSKRYPFAIEMSREMLRLAAQLHDASAQYLLGVHYLEEAKWRDQLEREKTFASQGNKALCATMFQEAVAYLTASSTTHILAKRMLGACYIFGWGLPANNDQGLALIVESITLENSWGRAAQILASLGLNRPEFFEALVKQRH